MCKCFGSMSQLENVSQLETNQRPGFQLTYALMLPMDASKTLAHDPAHNNSLSAAIHVYMNWLL